MKHSIEVPDDYAFYQEGTKTIIIKKEYENQLLKEAISSPEMLIRSSKGTSFTHTGRGSHPSIPIKGSCSERMIMRKYLRGGLLRFLIRDIYFGTYARPFKELSVSVRAYVTGIPTAEVLAALKITLAGPLYRGYLISKELPSCQDMALFLNEIAKGPQENFLKIKRAVLNQAAMLTRLMHDKGFYHGDLNLKNFLIETKGNKKMYIIDWDKTKIKKRLSNKERRKNILRFCRSMEKLKGKGLPITQRDQLFYLKSYWHQESNAKKRFRRDYIRMKTGLIMRKFIWKIARLFMFRTFHC